MIDVHARRSNPPRIDPKKRTGKTKNIPLASAKATAAVPTKPNTGAISATTNSTNAKRNVEPPLNGLAG